MAFPQEVYQFELRTEITAADVPYVQRFQELKLKANRTPEEETEMANLMARLRTKFISSEDWNKFQNALAEMQIFIRDNVAGYIDTARDEALIAIDQKKNAIIVYLDSLEAGKLRNDIGVMAELTTTSKSSLVSAVNEINQKTAVEASISRKGIVQLSDATNSSSIIEAATPNSVKKSIEQSTTYTDQRVSVGDIGITTNSGNRYFLTTQSGKPTTLVLGSTVKAKLNVANTGTPFLNVNGLGDKEIKKGNGNQILGPLLKASIYTFTYDGTSFILQGEGGSGNASASDLLSGKTASTDAGEIVGSMTNRGATNVIVSSGAGTIIPEGYHNGYGIAKVEFTAGDVAVYRDDTYQSGTNYSWTEYYPKRIRIDSPGSYNIRISMSHTSTVAHDIYAQVLKNGVVVGEVTQYSNFYVTHTISVLNVVAGDIISVRFRTSDTNREKSWTTNLFEVANRMPIPSITKL